MLVDGGLEWFDQALLIDLQDGLTYEAVLTLSEKRSLIRRFTAAWLMVLQDKIKSLQLHTGVWIIMARWSLMVLTISRGYTGWPHSIKHRAVSMVIRTPVRPMPALQ